MNTKKNKNKQKQNKPPNLQPKTEVETQIEKEEVKTEIEKVEEKSDPVQVEERVPEIVSEIVNPVLETKVTEGDTPKKPKRNRGKKKKSEREDDFDDGKEQKDPEDVEIKTTSVPQVSTTTDTPEETSTNIEEVTPVARKKKNKNKKQAEIAENIFEEELKVTPIKKGEELTDVKIVTLVPVTTETEESKSSKKKNKKKKRNDSERSEKAEEVISCTAAFQKLIEGKDDKKESKLDDKPSVEVKETVKEEVKVRVLEKDIVSELTLEEKPKDSQIEEGGKSKKKNKKDKKFPKLESEDEVKPSLETKTASETQEAPTAIPTDIAPSIKNEIQKEPEPPKDRLEEKIQPLPPKNIIQEVQQIKELSEKPTELPSIEKEKSPKPKAKIAKPVEMKRKGKEDTSGIEDFSEKVTNVGTKEKSTVIVEDKPFVPPIKEIREEEKPEIVPALTVETEVKPIEPFVLIPTEMKPEIKEEPVKAIQKIETIQLPDSGTGKKRKKSPKPKPAEYSHDSKPQNVKEKDIKTEGIIEAKKEETFTSTKPTMQDTPLAITEIKPDIVETKPPPSEVQEQVSPKTNIPIPLGFGEEMLPAPTETKILQTPEIDQMTEIQKENVLQETKETEKLQMPETGASKKRKKSPKLPKKFNKTPEVVEHTEQATISEEITPEIPVPPPFPKDIKKKEEFKVKSEFMPDLPPLEDIEIRSVKADESEGSSCDIVPDVQYPRARSQLLDDNNNTVIRDVTGTDVKINIPIVLPDTPVIQGSGATPLTPSEILTHIKLSETAPSASTAEQKDTKTYEKDKTTKTEEKTDLKSKVLDVNQGMEELRRSIERSLAELSAMEKNEKEAEEQFAKAQSKLEEITEMASKKSESVKKEKPPAENIQSQVEPHQKINKDVGKPNTENIKEDLTAEKKLEEIKTEIAKPPLVTEVKQEETKLAENVVTETPVSLPPPVCPARKDNKGKGKKKKGKHEFEQSLAATTPSATSTESSATTSTTTTSESKDTQDTKKKEKTEQKTDTTQEKGKQQSTSVEDENINSDKPQDSEPTDSVQIDFEPIEDFADALTSSVDDVNKTFEMIVNEPDQCDQSQNPEINITAPSEDDEKGDAKDQGKENPVSQPKNLLGHPDIPARLNKTDYKKEKNKTPNTRQAKVKIKDAVPIEVAKESKESQTENKRRFLKDKSASETISSIVNENEEYIYKYSFRKVFLPSACHVCKKDLKQTRVPCSFCNLVFYCSPKHKDEDYPQHQAMCFAVSTIVHLKDQKHIYGDAKNITGHDYRLLRMQMIVSCEKVLKRRLVPWEQEALLYPRICADIGCREWRQGKLVDCEGCGQIAYCSEHPEHLPKIHQRWCKSYSLYHKLVVHQQTRGRLEPLLPSRVMAEVYQMPEKLNEVLASMYEEKIDMTDIQYAALTQIATAPLTAAYCQQLFTTKMNSTYANGMHKKSSFTIHVVGAELQFEADALNKWEVFFLHLRPDVKDLRVVLVGPDLNPSKLPLDLLGKVKLCENCRLNKRRVCFEFQDKKSYYEYWSTDFTTPDLVCAFNPSIQRSSIFNGKDTWPATIKCITKLRTPFIITSYTMTELHRDVARIKECSDVEVNTISEAKFNAFASVRPDRNFISDDEMPLLFKNFCFAVVCGSL